MSLWPNGMKIEVLGITGPYASGKTLFALTIDPKKTLYYDFEKSGGTYDGLGVHRVDAPAEMLAKYPQGFRPVQVFQWWVEHLRAVPAGQYRVIVLDTIGDIEAGLTDWVKAKHKEYGFSTAEKFEAMGGVFWKTVRDEWKSILTQLAAKCETFAFTAHLRSVWKHGKPTESKEPVGKQTLYELASLYLWLSREERGEGNIMKTLKVPAANVLKSRLAHTSVAEDGSIEIVPLIPPRLPEATPHALRDYIANPRDFARLKKEERKTVQVMSDDERLALQAQIAEDERVAAEARLENSRRTEAAYARIAELSASASQTTEVAGGTKGAQVAEPPATSAKRTDATSQPKQEAAAGGFESAEGVTREQLATIKTLKDECGVDAETYRKALGKFDCESAKSLTKNDADRLIGWLQKRVQAVQEEKKDKDELNQWVDKALAPRAASAPGVVGDGVVDDEDQSVPFESGRQ